MRQAKQTLKELMAGLAVWGGFVFVILMIVSRHRLAVACGLLTGLGTAVWLIWHMYRHLDIALDLGEKHAARHIQVSSVKRFLVMAVVLVAAMMEYRYIHPIGTVLGMFGVKISASAPSVHMIKANITTEIMPLVGSKEQADDLVTYISDNSERFIVPNHCSLEMYSLSTVKINDCFFIFYKTPVFSL